VRALAFLELLHLGRGQVERSLLAAHQLDGFHVAHGAPQRLNLTALRHGQPQTIAIDARAVTVLRQKRQCLLSQRGIALHGRVKRQVGQQEAGLAVRDVGALLGPNDGSSSPRKTVTQLGLNGRLNLFGADSSGLLLQRLIDRGRSLEGIVHAVIVQEPALLTEVLQRRCRVRPSSSGPTSAGISSFSLTPEAMGSPPSAPGCDRPPKE
jgi:hypothetical protein